MITYTTFPEEAVLKQVKFEFLKRQLTPILHHFSQGFGSIKTTKEPILKWKT